MGLPQRCGSPFFLTEGVATKKEFSNQGGVKKVLKDKKIMPGVTAVIILIVIAAIRISFISGPKEGEYKIPIEPTIAEWSSDQNMGAHLPILDYASDNIVIFHSYFGLFVYNLDSQKLIRSLNLQSIGCADDSCVVSVSKDGNTVQLHPGDSESMYVYTIAKNNLVKAAYKPMEEPFDGLVSILDVMDFDKIGNYSHNAVIFNNGEFGCLRASEWTVSSLTYVRGEKVHELFKKK